MNTVVLSILLVLLLQKSWGFRAGGLAYRAQNADYKLSCFSDGACVAVLEREAAARRRSIEIGRTPDLGRTWTDTIQLDDKQSRPSAASLSCIEHSDARICVASWVRQSGDIFLSKSLDGGVSWSEASQVFLDGTERNFEPRIACFVDPQSTSPLEDFSCLLIVKRRGASLFLSALKLDNSTEIVNSTLSIPGFDALTPRDHRLACQVDASYCVVSFVGCSEDNECNVYSSRSVTSGASWTPLTQVPTSEVVDAVREDVNQSVAFPDLSLDCVPGTHVCILVADPYISFPGVSKSEQWIEISRSDDGGTSWSQMEVFHSAREDGFFLRPTVSCSADPHCVIAWELIEATFENESPFYRVSSDLGVSWEPALRVRDLPEIVGYRKVEISCAKTVNGCLAVFKISDSELLYASLNGFDPPSPTSAPTRKLPEDGTDTGEEEGDESNKLILWMGIVGSACGILLLSGLAFSIFRSKDLGGMVSQSVGFRLSKTSVSGPVFAFDESSSVSHSGSGGKSPSPPFGSSKTQLVTEFNLTSNQNQV